MAFVATGFIALCLMVAATFGASFDSATESHFVKDMSKKYEQGHSAVTRGSRLRLVLPRWAGWDSIFKGLFIVTSFPIILTYFMIAAVNAQPQPRVITRCGSHNMRMFGNQVNQGCRRCGLGKVLSEENRTINYSQDKEGRPDPLKEVKFKESELPVTLIAFKLVLMSPTPPPC